MSSENKPVVVQETVVVEHKKPLVCGGIGNARSLGEEELKIWDMYKEHAETKLRKQFKISEGHILKPIQVATQVVAGINYFFKVEVSDKKYATVRVYHVTWQKDTYGKADHVAVNDKLADSVDEDVGHF